MTGLQLAILKGYDGIAMDIIDAVLSQQDMDVMFGGGNTALHLATLLGAREVVRRLLERGAERNIKVGIYVVGSICTGFRVQCMNVSPHSFSIAAPYR
jgi:hypothetical protein